MHTFLCSFSALSMFIALTLPLYGLSLCHFKLWQAFFLLLLLLVFVLIWGVIDMDFQYFLNCFFIVFRTALAWHIPFSWGSFSMDFYPFYWLVAVVLIKKGFDLFFPLNGGDDDVE